MRQNKPMSVRRDNDASPIRIPLNEHFHRLVSGTCSILEIAQEQAAARAARIAREDDYLRRRRQLAELSDPFAGGYCH